MSRQKIRKIITRQWSKSIIHTKKCNSQKFGSEFCTMPTLCEGLSQIKQPDHTLFADSDLFKIRFFYMDFIGSLL